MQRHPFQILIIGGLLGGTAFAQFNIDCGVGFGTPANTYAAAAMQAGTWNVVNYGDMGVPLVDTGGAATSVVYSQSFGDGNFTTNNAGTLGDDEALLDDLINVGNSGSPVRVTIDGLADGNYHIYVYAWAPDNASYSTRVRVTPSTSPQQYVGGVWTGMHALGTTYGFFDGVTIAGGAPLVINLTTSDGWGSINGIQVVDRGGPVGTNYCLSAANSTDPVGAVISAAGSELVSAQNLSLQALNMPPNVNGVFYYGNNMVVLPFGDGFRCVGGMIQRLPFSAADASGTMTEPDVFLHPMPNLPIAPGALYFQAWFRDPTGPGGTGFNLSDGLMINFMP